MKNIVQKFDFNEEYMLNHDAVVFTLNKKTTNGHIYSWNVAPRFFPEDMKDSPIRIKYLMENAKKVGLDDLVMADQQIGDKLIEECHEISFDEFKEYYDSEVYKREGTVWNVDKFYNALFMTKETHDKVKSEIGRSVSLVFPAADCAVIRFYDPKKNVIGLTHSDAVHTTRGIIDKSVSYMVEHFGSNKEDIEVFVGVFAKDGWTYDKIPDFALNEDGSLNDIWKGYIFEENGKYVINYGDKIYEQIKDTGVSMGKVYFDPNNTLFNDDFFSNSRSYNSRVNGVATYREGRNMMGITFDVKEVVEKSEQEHVILR